MRALLLAALLAAARTSEVTLGTVESPDVDAGVCPDLEDCPCDEDGGLCDEPGNPTPPDTGE